MATEETVNSSVSAPADLPPYPDMIYAAIEALDEKNGANKTAISKHIEEIHGPLPPAHSTLLSHHLNRMKQSGQLVVLKNNYMKPDPNAPPRRGRGRPPKANKSSPPPSDAAVSSPRPRGRPPKIVDPLAPLPSPKKTSPSPSVSGRKRGRPRKAGNTSAEPPKVATPASGTPRGRGRPPKVKPAATATAPVGA